MPAAATGFVHPIWAMAAMLASVTAVLATSFAGQLASRVRGETRPGFQGVDSRPHDEGPGV